MRLCRFVVFVQNDPCYFFLLLFFFSLSLSPCNSLFCCSLQQSWTRCFSFLFSTDSGMQLNERAGHARFARVSALSSVSARRPVSGLVGSWTRSQVPLLPLPLPLPPLGLSRQVCRNSSQARLKSYTNQAICKEMKKNPIALRTSLARRPGFSIIAREPRTLLGPCIIIVTPVPSRDTQGRVYHQRLPPDSLLFRLENDSSVVLLSCQFREEKRKKKEKSDAPVPVKFTFPFLLNSSVTNITSFCRPIDIWLSAEMLRVTFKRVVLTRLEKRKMF